MDNVTIPPEVVEELREKVARAIAESEKFDWDNPEIADFHASFFRSADAAIALVLEEAARVAETCPHEDGWYTQGDRRRAEAIADAIRALKG